MMSAVTKEPTTTDAGVHRCTHRSRALPGGSEIVWIRRAFLAPLTILLIAVGTLPIIYGFYLSLTDTNSGEFLGFTNYGDLLASSSFWHTVFLTLAITLASVILTIGLGTWLAFAMQSINRGQHFLRALLLLPLASAPIAAMYSWKTMLNSSYGVVNYVLGGLGVDPIAWYGTSRPAIMSILVIDVWQWTSFAMVIIYGGLVAVPAETLEAAALDGAGSVAKLRYIVAPILVPYLLIAMFFRAVDTLKIFDSVAVLTSGGPGDSTTTMNWLAYRQMIIYANFGKGTAVAFLLLATSLIFSSWLVSHLRRASTEMEHS